jgi:hypothetical protein
MADAMSRSDAQNLSAQPAMPRSTHSAFAARHTAALVDTLNSPFFQAMPTFSRNGREVCFMAFRPEGFGGSLQCLSEIWVYEW